MIDCLFVLRDMGETKALLPVIERLASQGRDVCVLAVGQAAHRALETSEGRRISYIVPDSVAGE